MAGLEEVGTAENDERPLEGCEKGAWQKKKPQKLVRMEKRAKSGKTRVGKFVWSI